ncbi:MAG: hypothetical protein JWN26_115 [Candidatus Saccharibacteria bacterium]|nr:hypothetical protein [Candidatus Saccharibacteria bacterium]
MKSRQSQAGSAHLVIIIVLVVALLGALGFVFWQNFINKPVANQANSSQTTPTTKTDTTTTSPTATGFVVSGWSVSIPTTETGFQANSASSSNGYDFYGVTTAALKAEAAKENCNDSGIGSIYRATSLDGSPSAHSAKVGNYYYGFTQRSTAACVDANGNEAEPLNTLMMSAEADLKAAIVNTTAS